MTRNVGNRSAIWNTIMGERLNLLIVGSYHEREFWKCGEVRRLQARAQRAGWGTRYFL